MENRGEHPIQSYRTLLTVLLVLLLLTVISIMVSRLGMGSLRIPVALGIASIKTGLVLMFFMNIGRAGRAVQLTFSITILTLATFIGLTFFDILFR